MVAYAPAGCPAKVMPGCWFMKDAAVAGSAPKGNGLLATMVENVRGDPELTIDQDLALEAWNDEKHVKENRQFYREKFSAVIDILSNVCTIYQPPTSFYIWLKTPLDDTDFAKRLFEQQNMTVLPGSFLSRDFNGINPGLNHVRMALVAPLDECIEAANRIKYFINSL